ncbi:uncharacterized protein VTP21DRAFT_6045 [Calcarisporiella thermophila]|uniref:uncharacterized protein n=1 Tax=Calcarisporiella thermophila TaxID=911321 RepID=UPI0037448FFB
MESGNQDDGQHWNNGRKRDLGDDPSLSPKRQRTDEELTLQTQSPSHLQQSGGESHLSEQQIDLPSNPEEFGAMEEGESPHRRGEDMEGIEGEGAEEEEEEEGNEEEEEDEEEEGEEEEEDEGEGDEEGEGEGEDVQAEQKLEGGEGGEAFHREDAAAAGEAQREPKEVGGEEKQDEPASDLQQLEERAKRYLSEQAHETIIPSYAAWFDMARIHNIERKSLPEFFNGRNPSKTPAVYKDYRDFMINTYRLNPQEYLTVTACRRNLAGDVCAIIRVHAFLEQWGLINYQVDPETRPSTIGPPFTGHYRITADTPRGLQPFRPNYPAAPAPQHGHMGKPPGPSAFSASPMPGDSSGGPSGPPAGEMKSGSKVEANLEMRKSIYPTDGSARVNGSTTTSATTPTTGEDKKQQQGSGAHHYCFTCGTDCSRVRFHSTKVKSLDLCPNCFNDGRFPSTMSSGDFVKLEEMAYKHATTDEWSDKETLLLLEGLEMYDDDWNAVAEHVGTRTREQCILHFLQLPIEDPYIPAVAVPTATGGGGKPPYSQADNPVMSVVAFLASVVNPSVAAAAAQSAMKEMTTELLKSRKEKGGAETKEGEKGEANENEEGDEKDKENKGEKEKELEKGGKDKGGDEAALEVKTEDAMEVDQGAGKGDAGSEKPTETTEKGAGENLNKDERSTLERAAAAALGAAAAKAMTLSTHEEREVQRLVNSAVEAQLRKLELKMQQFEELETIVEMERRELEKQRQQLFLERLAVQQMMLQPPPQTREEAHQQQQPDEMKFVAQEGAEGSASMFGSENGMAMNMMPLSREGRDDVVLTNL